jgi:hypothetical protein
VQKTNGITPHELMFGRKADTFMRPIIGKGIDLESQSEVLNKMQQDMQRIQKVIIDKQNTVRQKEKEKYDRKTAGDSFEVGNYVLLHNTAVKLGESRKFSPIYIGPYKIISKEGVNFTIHPLSDKLKEQTVHQNRLKKYYGKIDDVNTEHTNIRRQTVENNVEINREVDKNDENDTDEDDEDELTWLTEIPSTNTTKVQSSQGENSLVRDNSKKVVEVKSSPTQSAIRKNREEILLVKMPALVTEESITNLPIINEENESEEMPVIVNEQQQEICQEQLNFNEQNKETTETMDDLRQEERLDINDHNDPDYVPYKKVTINEQRRNPPRNVRKPVRYGITEVDICSIGIVSNTRSVCKKSDSTKNKQNCEKESFSTSVENNSMASNMRKTGPTQMMLWQLLIFIICLLFTCTNANLILSDNQELGRLFGEAHACGGVGHYATYVEIPEIPKCIFTDPRTGLVEIC